MITPEQWDIIGKQASKIYSPLELEIIQEIAERIANVGYANTVVLNDILIAEEMGLIYQDIIQLVAKYNKTSASQIQEIFETAGVKSLEYDDNIYRLAGLNPSSLRQSTSMWQLLEATALKTHNNLNNLVMTTANSAQTQFYNAINKAYMEVSTGVKSYSQSITDTIKEISNQGLYITYPSGQRRSIESAVRMNIVTSINQTCGKLQEMRANELNWDLMELTAHSGARPEHAEWQGKIVSRSGQKGYLSLDDIGYGEVTGFKGVNCRHDWMPYYKGSSRTYSNKELNDLKNETVVYNGQNISKYEATQIQRRIERQIRQDKKEIAGLQGILTSGNKELLEDAKIQLVNVQTRQKLNNGTLNNFIKQTGLNKDYSRLRVATEKNTNIFSFNQDKTNNKRTIMNFQENTESFGSKIIKTNLYKNTNRKENIIKYENKIMNLYKKNKNENMAILDRITGKLVGNITEGKNRTTVGPDTKTLLKMMFRKENSLIAIHNHPENYSFSLQDIKTFNAIKTIDSMIVLTDDYKYYLTLGNGKRVKDIKRLNSIYKSIEKNVKKEYSTFNGIEIRDLANQKFFKKMGWLYEKEKN